MMNRLFRVSTLNEEVSLPQRSRFLDEAPAATSAPIGHFSSVVVVEPTDGGHGPGYCFNYARAFRQICPHVAALTVRNARDWGVRPADYDDAGIGFHEFTENQHFFFDWLTKSRVAACVKDVRKCIVSENYKTRSTLVYFPTLDTTRCDRSCDILARLHGLNLTGTLHWINAAPSRYEMVAKQRYLALSRSTLPVGCVTRAGWHALKHMGLRAHLMPDISPTAEVSAPAFWPALDKWLSQRPWLLLAGHINRNKNLSRFYDFISSLPENSGLGVVVGSFSDAAFDAADRDALIQMRNRPDRFWICDQRLASDACLNALISKCTAVWCGYRTSTSSSQILTKAAAFERPVVGIRRTEIGDRISHHKTGIILPSSGEAAFTPEDNLQQWNKLRIVDWATACKGYAQQHSLAALTDALQAMFSFGSPSSSQQVR